jgi:hypothetical protein
MDQEQLLNSFPPPVQTHIAPPISDKTPFIPDEPVEQWYEHTQVGMNQIGINAISAVIFLLLVPFSGGLMLVPLAIVIAQIALRSTLTVTVTDGTLHIRFGPLAWTRKSWSVAEISSVSVVKLPFNHIFGMGLSFGGKIYNTSGLDGVEIRMRNGKTFRIGTDEPEEVRQAIENWKFNTRIS